MMFEKRKAFYFSQKNQGTLIMPHRGYLFVETQLFE